jgi:DNA polymerase delta subunit 1
MVNFGHLELQEAMRLGKEAAKYITGHFKKPINLEFEKAFSPFLLLGKKKYAGLHWTNTDKYDKMDIKGIAIVRRDRCVLIQKIMQKSLDEILINRQVGMNGKAVGIVRKAISDLLEGVTDLEKLTFTGGWGKSEYKCDPPHVAVARKMMKRDPNVKFGPGDRMTYLITAGPPKSKVSERAENLDYVRARGLPIDVAYYLDAMKEPLIDIFSPIIGRSGNSEEKLRQNVEKELKWKLKPEMDEEAIMELRKNIEWELREKADKESRKKTDKVLFTGEHMKKVVKKISNLPSAFTLAGFTVSKK